MYGPSAHPPRKVATRPAQRIDSNTGVRRLDFVVVFIRYPPLLNFPLPISEPFTRLCLASCSLVNTRYSDFTVRFESDALIGRRSGEIRVTFWTAATYRSTPKRFASVAVFATVSLPMRRIFFGLSAFLTIVVSMFAKQPSPSTSEGNFDVIIRNG